MLRWVVVACVAGCYSPQFHDCTTQCSHSSDCVNGQVCGEDGWCAEPSIAGHCEQRVAANDAARSDGSRGSDAPPDADLCAAAGTNGTCDQGTCVIDCSVANSCMVDIVCPAGVPCRVVCGDKACTHHVTCPPASACEVQCTGAYSCGDVIACGTAPCAVTCSGYASCHRHTSCANACACDVSCTGTMACGELSMCPLGTTCALGHGCTSQPTGCDTCP